MNRPNRWIVATCLIAATCLLAACGKSSDSGGGSTGIGTGKVASATPPASGCGSYEAPTVKDPDGVVAALPKALKDRYAGYPYTVRKSAWSDWKPKHGPPYKVGVQWAQLSTDFQVQVSQRLVKELKKNPDISDVTFQSTGSNLDVPQQLQQTQALIRSEPDIIILEELQPGAFEPLVEAAGKRGIPVIVPVDSLNSKYAVNVNYNIWNGPAAAASVVVRQMGGKGNMLMAHAIPGTGADTAAFDAYDKILKNCPNIKRAGEVYGNFVVSTAKSETLKFLATHPEQIDGALQTAVMAPGIIDAFKQTGRPVPIVQDVTMMKASAAYWLQNRDEYKGAGMGFAVADFAQDVAAVAGRMLAGDGVTMTDILGDAPVVTDANLDEWADPSWTERTPGVALGPKDGYLTPADLNAFFNAGE